MVDQPGWVSTPRVTTRISPTRPARRWSGGSESVENDRALLAIVEVRVYERGAEAQVSFPAGALLG